MKQEQFNEFNKIMYLSEKMLDHARQQRWDDVSAFEDERRQLLTDFFAKPVNGQKGMLANSIRSILEKDREIVRLGSEKREELRGALQKFSRGKDVVQAYSAAV